MPEDLQIWCVLRDRPGRRRERPGAGCYLCADLFREGAAHAAAGGRPGEAWVPDHRAVRRPGSRARAPGDAGDDRARRAARLRRRLGALPAPAVRDLLPRRRARRRGAAHVADRARHGGDPARLGEPAAARRGPGDRGHPVRRAAQPGVQRRAADELGAGARGALSRYRGRRGLLLRAGVPAAAVRGRGDRRVAARGHRVRAVLFAGRAALARAAVPDVVRRRRRWRRRSGRASTGSTC